MISSAAAVGERTGEREVGEADYIGLRDADGEAPGGGTRAVSVGDGRQTDVAAGDEGGVTGDGGDGTTDQRDVATGRDGQVLTDEQTGDGGLGPFLLRLPGGEAQRDAGEEPSTRQVKEFRSLGYLLRQLSSCVLQ